MKLKLSTPQPRVELIASHAYGQALAAPAPPPPDEPKTPDADAPSDAEVDAAVSSALAELKAALAKATAAQAKDPDPADPNDKKVSAGLDAIAKALAEVEAAQAADSAGDEAEPDAKPVTAAAAPPQPDTSPVDAEGNVADDAVCANPDCGHLASSHLDQDDEGQNTGACQMTDCQCVAFQAESAPNSAGDDQAAGPAAPEGEEKLAVADAPVSPAPAAPAEPTPDLNAPPATPGGENMGPAFTIPVGVIEGQPTGDGRQIAPGALDWREPPCPLMGLATATHDPNGFDMNDPAVMCGRIDSFERVPGEGETQIVMAQGFYLANDDGQYFAEITEQMGRCGISADIATETVDMEVVETDSDGFPLEMSSTLTKGMILGFTQVPFPAFEGAYIVLGDGSEQPDAQAIPQTPDAPATPDAVPDAVAAGGQLVHLMSYEACEPCDQGLELIVAAGAGPVRPPSAWFQNPEFQVGDGRLVEILDRRGNRVIGGKYACPLTVTADGQVFGHIAPWGVCHTSTAGQCILAPRSKVDYAHFKRAQHILSAEGEKVRVGVLTCDAGHAPMRGISASEAMAHYDNTATIVADVNAGDDEHGIWVAGAIRPGATEEQIQALRAASISGDWRKLGGSLELVAALAVPVPGFPLVQIASGQHESLVAAGASVMEHLKHPAAAEREPGDVALRAALAPMLGQAKELARLTVGRQRARSRMRSAR